MDRQRLFGLDGLRGIAALCVLVYHAFPGHSSNAYLAVDFFFMLSGYVMARTYEHRLREGFGALAFLRRRYWRLWPPMLLGGLIGIPVILSLAGSGVWPAILANLLLVPWPMMNRIYPLNGPAWSILVELFANLVHATLLFRLSTRALCAVAAAALAVAMVGASQHTLEMGATPATVWWAIPRVLFSYTMGVVLFRRWRDRSPIRVSAHFTLLAMPLCFLGGAMVAGQSWPADILFVAVVCPMLIAGGLQLTRGRAIFAWLGAISFPLYALHSPILRGLGQLGFGPFHGMALSLLAAAAYVAIAGRLPRLVGSLAEPRKRGVAVRRGAQVQGGASSGS